MPHGGLFHGGIIWFVLPRQETLQCSHRMTHQMISRTLIRDVMHCVSAKWRCSNKRWCVVLHLHMLLRRQWLLAPVLAVDNRTYIRKENTPQGRRASPGRCMLAHS
jgi:hypothetical protein